MNTENRMKKKTAIVYASVHHGNTKKVLDAIASVYEVDLINASKVKKQDLSGYETVGFASGVYYSKYHKTVLDFAEKNMPQEKKTFFICTYGGKAAFQSIEKAIAGKNAKVIGTFSCRGYDTFGPFKLVGGVAKGHPDEQDLKDAVEFYGKIQND